MKINPLRIFLLITAIISTCFAQESIQVDLPDGAIARLGKSEINNLKFSPDGKQIAAATQIGVWLYDISNGKEYLLHTRELEDITAIGSANGIVLIWDWKRILQDIKKK